jgi:hypothetical protein
MSGFDADLFISYAWTPGGHREWVRLLAAALKLIGYNVLIDADVDYGDSLNGFMRKVVASRHVLLIADENYVLRADTMPDSGVGRENRWISDAFAGKPPTWLSVLFKDNPSATMPAWLTAHNPKGHWFHADPAQGNFPGSEQLDDLWRWIEGLPANKDNGTSVAALRERAARLERIALTRDPGQWHNPAISDRVHFPYASAPGNTFRMGFGEHEFGLMVTERGGETVAVYRDPINAVGLVRPQIAAPEHWEAHLAPGRVVDARPGDTVVLMNEHGLICRVDILGVQPEVNGPPYIAPHLDFRYEVIISI